MTYNTIYVRASIGTLACLGIANIRMDSKPTTGYLLQYSSNGCRARCSYCPQSTASTRRVKEYVSRVTWPKVRLSAIINALKVKPNAFNRICIQSVLKENFEEELIVITRELSKTNLHISVATNIVGEEVIARLAKYSDHLGVGLDACSPRIFESIGRPGTWDEYWLFMDKASKYYPRRNIIVHLIVGLGETVDELIGTLNKIYGNGYRASLFAFTPVRGTPMQDHPRPSIEYYRFAQLLNYLLDNGYRVDEVIVKESNTIRLRRGPWLGEDVIQAFLTRGCPSCNRPYYNESPLETPYNYPSTSLLYRDKEELWRIVEELLSKGLRC